MVQGEIRKLGYKAGINRIETFLREIDPIGSMTRRHAVVSRRVYKVPGPLSLETTS
jgi:hypothetical protein